MSESNQAKLRAGLDVYLEAMREFIKHKLIAAYPSTWWQDGVEKVLPPQLRDDLQRRAAQNPGRNRLDFIEPREVKVIMEKNFAKMFGNADYQETTAWLQLVVTARNLRAARGPGDIPDDVVADDLSNMRRLLSRAGLTDAAERIDGISKGVPRRGEPPDKVSSETLALPISAPVIQSRERTEPLPDQHDVMIQDVNPLNARIYFDGYMYVGGRKHCRYPQYFAPYFTVPCAESQRVPEVREAGVRTISRVFVVREIPVRQLMDNPQTVADESIRQHPYWDRFWRRGLSDISQRARSERFPQDNDPHRLYFLEEPKGLSHTIKKRPGFHQIFWGFHRTLAFVTSPGATLP